MFQHACKKVSSTLPRLSSIWGQAPTGLAKALGRGLFHRSIASLYCRLEHHLHRKQPLGLVTSTELVAWQPVCARAREAP